MNFRLIRIVKLCRSLLFGIVVIAAPKLCTAQSTNASTTANVTKLPDSGANPAGIQHDPRKKADEAKTLAKGNNVAAAETALISLNASQTNTAAWHIETFQRLLQVADQLSREGNKSSVTAMVNQSLSRLEQASVASRTERDVRAEAQAKALIGFVHERYRGDAPAAIASYRSALQLDPDDKATKEALERLQRKSAVLEARFQRGKGR
jgi:hypothetical protein